MAGYGVNITFVFNSFNLLILLIMPDDYIFLGIVIFAIFAFNIQFSSMV